MVNPNNASKQQMEFNSAFKGLNSTRFDQICVWRGWFTFQSTDKMARKVSEEIYVGQRTKLLHRESKTTSTVYLGSNTTKWHTLTAVDIRLSG